MKKILLGIFIGFSAMAVAQNVSIDKSGEVTIYGLPSDATIDSKVKVTNNSGSEMNVHVKREIIENTFGTDELFCWGVNCYPPSTAQSPNPEPIAAGGTNESFKGQLYPNGKEAIVKIKYCFFNADNPSEESCFTTVYDSQTKVGVGENNFENTLKLAGANPAKDLAIFNHTLNKNAELRIMSLAGSVAKQVLLDRDVNTTVIDISDLQSGLYIYSLIIDNKAVSNDKFMVRN